MFQEIITNQKVIYRRLLKMPTVSQFEQAFQAIDQETTRIGDYIETVLAQLNRTDLSDAEEAEQLAKLHAAAERLKGVGASVENPVPSDPLPS